MWGRAFGRIVNASTWPGRARAITDRNLHANCGIKNSLDLMFKLRGMWVSRFVYSDKLLSK